MLGKHTAPSLRSGDSDRSATKRQASLSVNLSVLDVPSGNVTSLAVKFLSLLSAIFLIGLCYTVRDAIFCYWTPAGPQKTL